MQRLAASLSVKAGTFCPRCGSEVPAGHHLCARCLLLEQQEMGESDALMKRLTVPDALKRWRDVLASMDVSSLECVRRMHVAELENLLVLQVALQAQLWELGGLQADSQAYADLRYEIALTLYGFPSEVRDLLNGALGSEEES